MPGAFKPAKELAQFFPGWMTMHAENFQIEEDFGKMYQPLN